MPTEQTLPARERRRLVRLDPEEIVWIERDGSHPIDVLVPAEYAPIIAVDLPLSDHRQRLAALPFALEGRLSQPIEQLHFALGPEIAPRRYLAAATDRQRMSRWLERLAEAEITPARLLPDVCRISLWAGGWRVAHEGGRVLARTSEGEGFAVGDHLFETFWAAAGRPALQRAGAIWPDNLPSAEPPAADAPLRCGPAVDLRQGAFGSADRGLARPLKIAAALVAAGALGHLAVLGADAAIAARTAELRRSEAVALLAQAAPGLAWEGDPAEMLLRLTPETAPEGEGGFTSLLSRAAGALQPVFAGASFNALNYDGAAGTLQADIEAADLAALERLSRALGEAGLDPESAGASAGEGRATGAITIRAGGGAS